MEYIVYGVTFATIVGTVANSFGKRWCFGVWMCTNGFWCVYNALIEQYAQGLLYGFNFAMAIVGLVQWNRRRHEDRGDVEMPLRYEDKFALCPYYHTNENRKIKCDGVEETASMHSIFKSDTAKKEYMKKYCCADWKKCRYARMMNAMWEEKL